MPAPSLDTQMIKAILEHRLIRGESLARCAQALGVSKGVVSKYVALARAQGLEDWSLIESMSDSELHTRLLAGQDERCPCVLPDFALMHRELSRKGMTLMLLWQEYQAEYVGQRTLQYSQFCERYRQYVRTLKRSMRQIHVAGEKLFVDFAGPTLALRDGSRAHLFVAALGASHYTYAQATPGQKTADWINGMVGALHYMGGVPALTVPDNPRAVIARADRYEPRATDSIQDFARYYDCAVLPARPHSPQDKAVVESAVQVVERWILARLRHVLPNAHLRSHQAGGFTTIEEHMPASHRAHRQWTPERLVAWGRGVGESTALLIEHMLARYRHPEHGYRSALGLLSLARRHGHARLDLLVQHEIDSRHDRRSARLLKQAGLKYAQAHIENLDARASRGLERARWMALALSDWASSGATIILNGATGCGKSCPSITGMPAWIDEPAVADAMLDRLLPQAQRIVLKGESLRAARTKKTPSSANQS